MRTRLRSWWQRFPLRVKTLLVAGIPILGIGLAVPLLFSVQRDTARVSAAVEHAYGVRDKIADVLGDLVDAETGMRGFLLTSEREFLGPYFEGVAAVPDDLASLERRVKGNPASRATVRQLLPLADRRLRILDKIHLFAERTPAGTTPDALLERGRIVMEDMRDVLDELDAREAATLKIERRRLDEAHRLAFTVSVVAIPSALLLTIAAVLGFTTGLVRGIGRIEENARRLERGEPLLDPPKGEDELARLGHVFAHTAARLTEQDAELRELALVDPLTKLPNRRAFLQIAEHELQIALRRSSVTALMFVDADGLKAINDELGHAEGDEMLREIGELLRTELRASDLVARLGGDEFCVLLSRDTAMDGTTAIARLETAVARKNAQPDRRYTVGFSVGVAFFDPADPVGVEDLIRKADAAMYEHKRSKRAGRVHAQLATR